jgi:YtkA-like
VTLKFKRASSSSRPWRASHILGALLALATPAFAVLGCHQPAGASPGITIEESIAPQPVRTAEETISIRLADPAHQPVTGARIQVEGDMDHPGMAPLFADAHEVAPGRYTAPLHFTMPGDWVVLLHITLAGGQRIERQDPVRGVQPN